MIADILVNPTFDAGRAGARAPGGAAGAGPGARHARRHHLRSSASGDLSRTSRWAGRSWARRRRSTAFTRGMLRDYMAAQYRAGAHDPGRRPARWRIDEIVRLAEEKFAGLPPRARRGATPPAHYVGGDFRDDRGSGAGAYRLCLSRRRRQRDPDISCRPDLCHGAGRRHVVAPVPGSAREARPLLFHLCLHQQFPGYRLHRHLCRHRRKGSRRDRRR